MVEAQLQRVLAKYEKELLRKANVTGVAIGEKKVSGQPTGEICIVVFVRKKLPLTELRGRDVVPSMLDGYKTDVVEAEFFALAEGRTSRIRPAKGGISVGHYQITAGTITNIFYDYTKATDDALNALTLTSNNHVIAHSDLGKSGDPVLQPGPADGGTIENDTIATLDRWYPLSPGARLIDGAVATPISQDDVTPSHYDFGVPSTPPTIPRIGMKIRKGGRTTGLTEAVISYVNATVYVSGYPQGAVQFTRQIIAEAGIPWIRGGDSGSLAVEKNTNKCLGVCFAGTTDGLMGVMNDYRLFSQILKIGLPALLRIKVTDREGKPISDAVVTEHASGTIALTDASGSVWIGNVPLQSKVLITASHPDFQTTETEVSVDNEVLDVQVKLSPKPPRVLTPAEVSAYAGTYLGVMLSGVMICQSVIVPELVVGFKELKEAIV